MLGYLKIADGRILEYNSIVYEIIKYSRKEPLISKVNYSLLSMAEFLCYA